MEVDIAGKLFPNVATMIVQLLSTGILFYFFMKFLYGPLQTYLGKRASFIEQNINEAKDMNAKAKVHMEESEKLAKVGALEYREVVEKAKTDAQAQKEKILDEARAEASYRLEQAAKQIESEKVKAQENMRKEMVEIALSATKKVVEKEIDEEKNRDLITAFIDEVNR